MGVIDLDARVKKLEAGGGGGADPGVIDQLEAAVTDLEETVNGNGETDFGLVGDVAALEETVGDLIEDLSDKITLNASVTFGDGDPVIHLTRIGNLCFLQLKGTMTAGYAAAGSSTTIGTLDASIRPDIATYTAGMGENNSIRLFEADPSGVIISMGGNYFRAEMFWKLPTPTP